MILFSLALALGFVRKSPLTPGVLEARPSNTLPSDRTPYEEAFTAGMQRLIGRTMHPGRRGYLFSSGSFGKDDPFTLTWCSELLRALWSSDRSDHQGLRAGGTFGPFVEKFYWRAQCKLRAALASPQHSCLQFSGKTPVALDHLFPLVRALHLAKSLEGTRAVFPTPPAAGSLEALAAAAAGASAQLLGQPGLPVYDYLLKRIHEHLSYHTMPNARFDAAELVFALEGILLCGPHPGTADEELLQRIFQVIDERQQQNPYWRPLKPFVTTPQGFALLPLSVEIANSLLRVCTLLAQSGEPKDYFSRYLQLFTRYTEWLENRVDDGKAAPAAGAADGPAFVGWHSEHVYVPGTVHTWETSQVLLYLLHFRGMLQKHLAEGGLAAANLVPTTPPRHEQTASAYWTSKMVNSEPLLGCPASSDYCVFRRIGDDFLKPWESLEIEHRHCSALLYGPPGTGKTRIAEEIAAALGWPLLSISPSDFVARGESEVEMRAKAIFEVLHEQAQVVVLFDEIDRLVLDRDSKLYREQGDLFQFMTPGMLPKLNNLRKAARVIFLIGTNYADRIDPAAKRKGRIDDQLLVTPPDLRQRRNILQDLLLRKFNLGVPDAIVQPAAVASAFAIYKELEALVVSTMNDVLAVGPPWPPQVGNALERRSGDLSPELRLTVYESRFRQSPKGHALDVDRDFPAAHEPFEEFFLLVYLKCDAHEPVAAGVAPDLDTAFNAEERALIRRVALRLLPDAQVNGVHGGDAGAIDEMVEALSPFLRDEHVLGVLKRWRFGV
jgi:hypothetical protein